MAKGEEAWTQLATRIPKEFYRRLKLHCVTNDTSVMDFVVEARTVSLKAESGLTMLDEKRLPESFHAYEDGKHRRYSLLFSVNGGAFAIAKLLADKNPPAVLGNPSLRQLSFGMILFTIVMVADIFVFGEKMRTTYLADAFGWQGKAVLLLIGFLICAGWFLVA